MKSLPNSRCMPLVWGIDPGLTCIRMPTFVLVDFGSCRRKVKEEMTKIWKKIYEQNYPRSLDHRSFYFKQQVRAGPCCRAAHVAQMLNGVICSCLLCCPAYYVLPGSTWGGMHRCCSSSTVTTQSAQQRAVKPTLTHLLHTNNNNPQEKKNLMAKAMVAEVKETADRRKAEAGHLRCLSMGHRYSAPAAPASEAADAADLSFEYVDK